MEDPDIIYRDAGDKLIDAVRAIPDPVARIDRIKDLINLGGRIHGELAQVTRDTVREMNTSLGMSYTDIARALGVTRARAQQLAEGR